MEKLGDIYQFSIKQPMRIIFDTHSLLADTVKDYENSRITFEAARDYGLICCGYIRQFAANEMDIYIDGH